ncbi:MAG: hypothetical protein CL424_13705 [Acidimicrobiaceae bacterium]|nr:hypothetical protein [Acidimicrobiaceae bacterium]
MKRTTRRTTALAVTGVLALGGLTACEDDGDGIEDDVEQDVEEDVNDAENDVDDGVDEVEDELDGDPDDGGEED